MCSKTGRPSGNPFSAHIRLKAQRSEMTENNNIPDILQEIIAHKKGELSDLRPDPSMFATASVAAPPLDFAAALRGPGLSVIAEIKQASPSAGIIAGDFDLHSVARAYAGGGADAVSILTEKKYFMGNPQYIPELRPVLGMPILRKDFIIDESQIRESRFLGADSFLLIAAALDKSQLKDFILAGRELGMEPLVEVHTLRELENAMSADTLILGINNRNLHTFEVDIGTSVELARHIPPEIVSVAESGIKSAEDAAKLSETGFDAVLVGEALMRHGAGTAAGLIKKFHALKR